MWISQKKMFREFPKLKKKSHKKTRHFSVIKTNKKRVNYSLFWDVGLFYLLILLTCYEYTFSLFIDLLKMTRYAQFCAKADTRILLLRLLCKLCRFIPISELRYSKYVMIKCCLVSLSWDERGNSCKLLLRIDKLGSYREWLKKFTIFKLPWDKNICVTGGG